MSYDALLFDLDGTLWNTLRPVADAWNQVATERGGLPRVTPEQIRSIMGLSHGEAFAKLLPGVAEADREAAAPAFYDREIRCLVENYLYPGVAAGLERLAGLYPLYLVSNCQPEYLERFYALSALQKFFQDSECFGATGRPKGENISSVLRRNQRTRGAYIGDTAGDQIAARHAGADYYHVNYGFGSPAQECMAFDTFHQVVEFFVSLKEGPR